MNVEEFLDLFIRELELNKKPEKLLQAGGQQFVLSFPESLPPSAAVVCGPFCDKASVPPSGTSAAAMQTRPCT